MDRSDAIRDQISILSKMEGFFEASVMFALLRLDLFEALGQSVASISQLSRKTGADARCLGRLLRCAATMEFVESLDGEHFRLSRPSRDSPSERFTGILPGRLASLSRYSLRGFRTTR